MRLTLRTLLAWIDDTLPPAQVREIGNQVAESPFAQELVERIRRVTRQRRLTVPRSSGPEWIDPNLVASYLDNELDADHVAELEKQCLSIDVCLAEVASVHQILSLLGQRAKVPAEAKERMYQLVKGREAIPMKRQAPAPAPTPLLATSAIVTWTEPERVAGSQKERNAFLAGILASLILVVVSAWYGLSVPATSPLPAEATAPAQVTISEPAQDQEEAAEEGMPSGATVATAPEPLPQPQPSAPTEAAVVKAPEAPKPTAPSEKPAPPSTSLLPPGAVGQTTKGEDLLLRYNEEKREWEHLPDVSPLNPSDRIVCLAPCRSTLDLASVDLVMQGGAEALILSNAADDVSRITPRKGRFKIKKTGESAKLILDLGNRKPLTVEFADVDSIAFERLIHRTSAPASEQGATWTIYCPEGKLSITQDNEKKDFSSPAVVTLSSAGAIEQRIGGTVPGWVIETELSPADRELRTQFLRSFRPGRPILAEIVTATEENQGPIRRLAIAALTTLGDLSYVMPLLDRKDAPEIRREAIAALRDFMSLGTDSAQQAGEQIREEFGNTTGPFVEKLLAGYTVEEANKPDTLRMLVNALGPDTPSVGVRELCLDNLLRLSGRDSLGYDPDQPDGDGLTNWKKLLSEGKILQKSPPTQEPSQASE